uniref:Nuclear protein MDM1 n=1 Tax=Scleropages formosus TaxID=113540 RepID=A0A8C9WJG5_SCLFO
MLLLSLLSVKYLIFYFNVKCNFFSVHRGLRTRAGFRTKDHKGGLYSSEYQRQFLWKAPAVSSPLLAAEQVLTWSTVVTVIPPFKTDPLILESEYRRNFRGSPPPQGPRLHRDLEDREGALFQSENVSPESAAKVVSSWSTVVFLQVFFCYRRKLKTEYNSNYRSPLQYRYKDGIWMKAPDMSGFQVRELREKAEAYRKRAWGTHFSRDHLSQILSEHNQLWEASTTSSAVMDLHGSSPLHALDLARTSVSSVASQRNSVGDGMDQGLHDVATLPVQKRLAWEDATKGDGPELKSQLEREQEKEKQHSEKQEEEVINKAPGIQHLSLESISDTSRDEGRVPTPKLKTIAVVPRTHHDLTTPVTGNHSSAPEIYFCTSFCSSMKLTLYSGSVQVSPAVGLSTLDPIPLREDFLETELHPEDPPAPCHDRSFQKHNGCGPSHLSITAPAVRIQGKLRDPEFQHNGKGISLSIITIIIIIIIIVVFLITDDRMSLISSMSAASCSFASQVLARAQKRKEDFWGKN